jgi:molybdenum cofactor guanylyltransferase
VKRGLARSDLTLAILAGGTGKRLGGAAKGLLTLGGRTFFARVLELGALCSNDIVVSSDPAYDRFGVHRIEDVEPGHGAPGGVTSALLAAPTPWVLVVACDMPFVTLELAQLLIDAAGEADVTCFLRAGEIEPLFGVYRSSLGESWRSRLGENPRMRSLVLGQSVRTLEPADPAALDSINTPEQLAKVKR